MPTATISTTTIEALRRYRPVRYAADDQVWQQPAIDAEVASLRAAVDAGDEPDPIEQLAARRVALAERGDCRSAHEFLRAIGRNGQYPLFLADEVMPLPIRIHGERTADDRKVRLEVCSTSDFVAWELGMRRKHDASTRRMLEEVASVPLIVRWMTEQNVDSFGSLNVTLIPVSEDLPPLRDDDDL